MSHGFVMIFTHFKDLNDDLQGGRFNVYGQRNHAPVSHKNRAGVKDGGIVIKTNTLLKGDQFAINNPTNSFGFVKESRFLFSYLYFGMVLRREEEEEEEINHRR